jgi:glycosyltransferase involved in cell wall biosynthesis
MPALQIRGEASMIPRVQTAGPWDWGTETTVIRVLSVIATLDRSGAEKQFSLVASRLPADEFDVHAVALTRGGPYEEMLREANVPLTILHKRLKFDPVALWRLRRLIRSHRPDVLHTWLFTANAYGRLAAGRKPDPAVVVSERCVDRWKGGWQHETDRRLIPRTDRWIANSQSVADFYREQGVPAERMVIIPNGVELPPAEPLAEDERNRRLAEFDLPPGARVVGFAGRLAPQKRLRDLIWGIQLLRQLTENVYFLMIGDGPEADDLRQFARKMTCEPFVRFAGPRDDAAELMRLLNVFWLASDFEGLSNSLMEAMAAGVPAVVSDIPPNRELVLDGETGFLVKVGDSPGYAQFAERILADPALSARLGNAARLRVAEHFGIEPMIQAHAKLFRELSAERKRRS